jgi:NAD(P)-dependent dehydrogenase (short-subunit alcohol dehydrogenase family)
MVRQNSGCIINVASVSGVVGPDFRIYGNTGKTSPIDYAFTKGGMLSLTRYLATYLAPYNIRVNAISPGGLYYPGRQTADFLQTYSDKVPLRRMAVADDIKGAVVFLASPAAAYITGQNLVLDGGLTVW